MTKPQNVQDLEKRLMAHINSLEEDIIPVLDRSSGSVLSFAQQRLWLLDQMGVSNAEYVMGSAYRLQGGLNLRALESAFMKLIARHEILRTRYVVDETGDPIQVVDDGCEFQVREFDLSHVVDSAEREAAMLSYVQEQLATPFDLSLDSGVRVSVVYLEPDDCVLVVALHHIAADGWSMGVLSEEVSSFYQAYLDGVEDPLPPLGVQYADFAQWQRGMLTDATAERLLGYWRKQLAGSEPLEMPADRPRPPIRTGSGESFWFDVPADAARQLSALASQKQASLFMAGLASFVAVLSRWSNQDDVVVGSPIAGRGRPEIEDLIGFFVNTVALRTDVHGDSNFLELLEGVREVALGAYAHQELPFERLVEELAPERDLGRNPLFDVLFALNQSDTGGHWSLPALRIWGWGWRLAEELE